MKYRRSDYAKFATLTSLALALTLTACAPAAHVAATSTTAAASEEVPAFTLPPAVSVEEETPSAGSDAVTQIDEPATATVPAPEPEPAAVTPVIATPSRSTPVSVPAAPLVPAQPTVPVSEVATPPAVNVEAPVTPVVPSTPHVSPSYGNGTFTFPDGHISFDVPAGWSIQVEQDSYNENAENPGGKENSLVAYIFDETGGKVAHISSGGTGGLVGGPVNRKILDSQELGAFHSRDGASHFVFVRDDYPSPDFPVRYYMGVVADYFMTEGPGSTSLNSFMIMPNGAATAVAEIDASMTAETAETWMKTDQYVKLRALLTSLRYAA
ncbi:hypothetical protein J2790_000163 [Paenarthrobacter nicotinovorans]|uniref:hypothetical protein n=1 Tax=Micrococcaceae TaxID=1268 RepID=UPI0008767CD5|nr:MULTISPECIES: hypothetical protein [Micrococcaceae]MDR6435042.1 hypothetical protein [Paenarthrobacter nicotinovorans]SCZ59009.1 hypothetical protein SAMN02799638_02609 [Arthrobacter sp. UNCCL28]